MKDTIRYIIIFIAIFFLSGCAVFDVAKGTAVFVGKAAIATVKTTGKIVYATGKTVKTLIEIPMGVTRVKLTRRGNSYIVPVVLNRKVKARMILDTGATSTQITRDIAKRLKIGVYEGEQVKCTLAGGRVVSARAITIDRVKVGRARIKNVRAVILDHDRTTGYDGLLGMNFLNNFKFKIDPGKSELILERRRDQN